MSFLSNAEKRKPFTYRVPNIGELAAYIDELASDQRKFAEQANTVSHKKECLARAGAYDDTAKILRNTVIDVLPTARLGDAA
jgi:hypothetical protein